METIIIIETIYIIYIVETIEEIKSWLFKNVNETDKPLPRLYKKKGGRLKLLISKIKEELSLLTFEKSEREYGDIINNYMMTN